MADVRTAHTADLEPSVLAAARALLYDVFAGELTDADWEHALGGIHALAWEDDALIGHASVIQRRLWLGGRALRTGYVEGVGVRADSRGRGVTTALMDGADAARDRAHTGRRRRHLRAAGLGGARSGRGDRVRLARRRRVVARAHCAASASAAAIRSRATAPSRSTDHVPRLP